MIMHQKRFYRNVVSNHNRVAFRVTVKETDLFVQADKLLAHITRELILKYRAFIESYINQYPEFLHTMAPWNSSGPMSAIINDMVSAGKKAGVGPMAAVAGAIAQCVGLELLSHSNEVVVENGGDIFLKTDAAVTMGIFAGTSPLSMRLGLCIEPDDDPVSVCTSSGTVGHSLSLGKADAVCVMSNSCSLADAAATSIGNCLISENRISSAINFGKNIEGVKGIVVIMGEKIGVWGDLEVVPLNLEKG